MCSGRSKAQVPLYPRRQHVHSVSVPQRRRSGRLKEPQEAAMKAFAIIVRTIALTGLCCLVGTARADGPSAQVFPGSLVFGVVPLNQSLSQTVTFTVTSPNPVTLNSITIGGTNALEFTETDNCFLEGHTPQAFPQGQGCSVNVTFAPTATGAQTASLAFATDGVNPPLVPLSGGIP